jgi:protein-disulfide isomerase
MNKRSITIITIVAVVLVFAFGASYYNNVVKKSGEPKTQKIVTDDSLVRTHSPIMGPENAPVTIVEFFDPSCEACRAFYPTVKQVMAKYPQDVRVILRYAPFHQGSDIAIGILEAARKQDKFEPVLEALLQKQPEWAIHGAPNLDRAWEIAGEVGLDVAQAKVVAAEPFVADVIAQDRADIRANNVRGTPTFFVNGGQVPFGPEPFNAAVDAAVAAVKK